jgi:hypothetical protein
MSEPTNRPPASPDPSAPLFTEPPRERSFPAAAVIVAAVAIVVVVVLLFVLGRHRETPSPTTVQPAAAYSTNLAISEVQMSESESLSGGKSTYMDGHIVNHGSQTVTGITAQVLFPIDGQPPQVMTVPMNLIRTREPYIDTEPLSAAPLAPGGAADFRLIFEGVSENWDQQKTPELHIIAVHTK